MGKLIRARVEFGVGESLIFEFDGDHQAPSNSRFEQFVNGLAGGISGGGVVEVDDDLLFGGADDLQFVLMLRPGCDGGRD